ncbi:hypothetical protein [Croceicoccus sediminis]|uniref:hypothetical protein n=1 Tax=Croceicoccus sediminis TaxID=2571150 RepID=UPI0011824D20|nr:hypothetical protein [Croceicoccus sediminis]
MITDMKPAAFRTLVAIGLATALAACGSDSAAPVDDNREAGGEVLQGTITDDMIPLDQLKSRGQSADAEGDSEGDGGDAADNGAGNETEAADAAGESPDEAAGGDEAPSQ